VTEAADVQLTDMDRADAGSRRAVSALILTGTVGVGLEKSVAVVKLVDQNSPLRG
jgi:hypothetical protein